MGGSLDAGTVLDGTYEIVRLVGWGGMGHVYEARHARLPGRFAVKVLVAHVSTDAPDVARFRREAEIASSLRHPNIVQVVDFNQMQDGTPYLVMEFLEGRDLGAELEAVQRLPFARAADVVTQIASALAAAHDQGIVHRDLKPQNVFLTPVPGQDRELVKILDFGISKVRSAVITTETRLIGTPQYMSPEQARCESDVDARTDQFALAAIAYEMLAGRAAFAGDNVPATLLKVANEDPAPLGVVAPDAPPGAEAVLRRALSKGKGPRFESVLAFAEAFAAAPGAAIAPATTAASLPGTAPFASDDGVRWTSSPSLRYALVLAAATFGLLLLFNPWGVDSGEPVRAAQPPAHVATPRGDAPTGTPAPTLQSPARKLHAPLNRQTALARLQQGSDDERTTEPRRDTVEAAAPSLAQPMPPAPRPTAPTSRGIFIDNLSGALPKQPTSKAPESKGTFVDAL